MIIIITYDLKNNNITIWISSTYGFYENFESWKKLVRLF